MLGVYGRGREDHLIWLLCIAAFFFFFILGGSEDRPMLLVDLQLLDLYRHRISGSGYDAECALA